MQMNEMVAKTEETAIPVSDVVNIIVDAATTAQPKVGSLLAMSQMQALAAASCSV
jgi:hypothetical protein